MINRTPVLQRGLSRAAIWLAVLILVAAGCGGIDPASSDSTPSSTSAPPESSATADDDNGNGNGGGGGGGIVWPSLPTGPDIPQIMEVYVYSVLEEADYSRCAALLLAEGVEVELGGSRFVVTLDGPSELSFETGDRTRLLYEAGARLCAGDETAAREAFAAAVGSDHGVTLFRIPIRTLSSAPCGHRRGPVGPQRGSVHSPTRGYGRR